MACAVTGCEDPAKSNGMCWRHYGRWRRNGDPLGRGQHGGHNKGRARPPSANVPDSEPLRVLRSELQQRRAQGVAFAEAWQSAVAIALDGLPDLDLAGWREVLAGHRAIWQAAYERQPLDALDALQALDERDEPEPDHRRSAPPLVLTGARHDGASELEPVVVPWCS